MNPKCPYCGAEMRREWCGFYYECPKCFSQSPYVEKGSTRAAALQRYVEPANGCCWCIADGVINKVYIRTDDSEYTFIDARFCPKCGKDLEDSRG